jgi:hypothetical protein
MQLLQSEVAQRFKNGLSRKSVTDASRWATKYRFMGPPYPGLYSFLRHPWCREMHDSRFPSNVGMKSAQMGFTEVGLNLAFFGIDVEKINVLYVLPNKNPDASDFSSSRFDPALELSDHLQNLFSNVQNVGHKRAGAANLFIRGSNSRSQLKSIPAGLIIFDELEEMTQENIPLAMERLSGQLKRSDWKISTPMVPNDGIHKYFLASTQDEFFFPCPSCGKWITLHFDPTGKNQNNLIITGETQHDPSLVNSHLICHECKNKLPHEGKIEYLQKGKWVGKHEGRDARGFYINQLFGMNEPQSPIVLAKAYLAALINDLALQEYWNSKIGIPRVPENAQLTDDHIEQCVTNQRQVDFRPTDGIITMGVDVGKKLHVVINDWELHGRSGNDVNSFAIARNLYHTTVYDFEELDHIVRAFRINYCVIDAQPETRKAIEFANRFYGRIRACRYTNNVLGRMLTKGPDEELTINVDRTSWLDMTLGRFRSKTIKLPIDTKLEYKAQMKTQVRVTKLDKHSNPVSRYVTPGDAPDHYAHAANYAEIALPLALGIGINEDYKE